MIDERVSRDRVVKKVVGFKKLDELKSKIDYCTISLKKEDCADLPEKIEQEIIIDMSPEHRIFYLTFIKRLIGELDDATVSVTAAIEKYTRVRQICGGFFPSDETGEIRRVTPNAKLQTLMDDIDGTDEKIVIVCCYHEEVNFLYENFIEEFGKDSVVCYTGRQSIESRNANLENFKTKLETRFLILNPQTGSYGLNLQFCHIIYYYSIPNSSELFEQGKDRIHRQGQKEMCLYKYFLYRDSEDVKSKCRLDAKKDGAEKFYSKQDIKKYLLEELNGY
jgi:SNF2 family DNA or RNA helicase